MKAADIQEVTMGRAGNLLIGMPILVDQTMPLTEIRFVSSYDELVRIVNLRKG